MAMTGNGGRPIGLPKTGGRKKGTPNRATLTLKEKLDGMGCDPLIELARIAMNERNAIEMRVQCLIAMAPYLYPKRKPSDASERERPVINMNTYLDDSGDPSDVRDKSQPEAQAPAGSGL